MSLLATTLTRSGALLQEAVLTAALAVSPIMQATAITTAIATSLPVLSRPGRRRRPPAGAGAH
jgi:hypothetical protein